MHVSHFLFRAASLLVCLIALIAYPVHGSAEAGLEAAADQLEARGFKGFKHGRQYFHIQMYRSHRRYHSKQPTWVAFHGGDGFVVTKAEEATWFYIINGQLITIDGHYVLLEFSNGYAVFKWSVTPQAHGIYYQHNGDYLEIHGPHFSSGGKGEGRCCVSDDGNLFVEGWGRAPFQCQPLDLRPNHGPKPLPSPTWKPPPHPHQTTSRPHWTTHAWPTTAYTTKPQPTTHWTSKPHWTTKPSHTTKDHYTTTTTSKPNPSWDPDPDMVPRDLGAQYFEDEEA